MRHPGCFLHLQLRAPWSGEAATGIRAQERSRGSYSSGYGAGGPHSSHPVCAPHVTRLPAPSLLLAVHLSICLFGSEAQAWSDPPRLTPRRSQLSGPTCTGRGGPSIALHPGLQGMSGLGTGGHEHPKLPVEGRTGHLGSPVTSDPWAKPCCCLHLSQNSHGASPSPPTPGVLPHPPFSHPGLTTKASTFYWLPVAGGQALLTAASVPRQRTAGPGPPPQPSRRSRCGGQ